MGRKPKSSKKKPAKSSSKKAKANERPDFFVEDDAMYSEVDQFHMQKDKISLNKDDDEAELDGTGYEAGIMQLPPSDDEDDDDDDSDQFPNQGKNESDEEDHAEWEEREKKEEENISKAWGKGKNAYYGADSHEFELMDDDEEELLKEEEAEGLRLQQEQAEDYDEEDLALGDVLEQIVSSDKSKTPGGKSKKSSAKEKKKKKKSKQGDLELLQAMNADLDGLAVEKISKDVSQMSDEEKQQLLLTDAPELLLLLEELGPTMTELEKQITPLIERVAKKQLPTSRGISFLEVKNHLLLTYCINICFYLLLKAEGKPVKKHPVIKQLATVRVMLEKMKSVDTKLKYQVDKLLKQAEMGSGSGGAQNALSFKPNPNSLVAKDAGDDDEASGGGDGLYKPPRMSAVTFNADEKETAKRKKVADKARKKAQSQSVVAHLKAEVFPDRPEEIVNQGEYKRDKDTEEREDYEEDNFMRLMETKADKKKRKQAGKIKVMEDLDDFGDLTAITEGTMDEEFGGSYLANKKKAAVGAKSDESSNYFNDFDSDDEREAFDYMDEVDTKSKRKKQKREEEHPQPAYEYGEQDPFQVEEGSRRKASKKILGNRGLTRARPKEKKNPRVKHRNAYSKALIKRRSVVQEKREQKGSYGGEASGVKTHLVRSRALDK